jgi:hypothetical protein
MTNQVPKTDGRGFPSGAYLNQNHPMDRTQWLEDTFPEWGSFLNREIEGYEVPKGQVSLWWCGGPSWVLKTDEGGIFMIDQYCGPSMYTELYYCGVCKHQLDPPQSSGDRSLEVQPYRWHFLHPCPPGSLRPVRCEGHDGHHRRSVLCTSRSSEEAAGLRRSR